MQIKRSIPHTEEDPVSSEDGTVYLVGPADPVGTPVDYFDHYHKYRDRPSEPIPDPLAVAVRAWEAAVEAESVSHRRYVAAEQARHAEWCRWQIDAAAERIALETVQRIKAEREGQS